MRIAAGQLKKPQNETLKMVKQLGVDGIHFNTPNLPGEKRWEYKDILKLRKKCEDFGLKLEAIENVPFKFYDKIMLGLPGRETQLEHMKETIKSLGDAGIPILGYHFEPTYVWRTSENKKGRGGAKVSLFEYEQAKKGINTVDGGRTDIEISSAKEMWDHFRYFMEEIIPIAEEAGVKLALHPSDPPVKSLAGVPRLFHKKDSLEKAMEIANSDVWGLDLCLGTCSSMKNGAQNVRDMINYFGPKNKILYVHFRDVSGTVPNFKEGFINEGNYNSADIFALLKKVGFSGFIISDHVPKIINDTNWGHRARAHAIGYLQGLLDMLNHKK